MENNTLFYQAVVINNEDPMMLGRVRARFQNPPSDMGSYDDIIKSIKNPPWNEEKDPWTSRDPFVFTPLMPYFIYQVPKVEELIQLVYLNKDFKFQNQYYIQSNFSSPTATNFEYNQGANKYTGVGMQYKSSKPLKNQDGTYTDSAVHKGVFPEPGDNGILGRGSADVIVKENETLIRAGKFKGLSLQPNVPPVANSQRGFLQLSRFSESKLKKPDKVITQLNEQVVSVNYLIEWAITNPENTQEKFTGSIYLYRLKNDLSTNSKNLTVDSVVKENLKSLVASESFNLLSKAEVAAVINNFIQTCNSSNVTKSGTVLFTDSNVKFPIFYRPNNITYNYMKSSAPSSGTTAESTSSFKNVSEIFNQVKLKPALRVSGYGLIYAQGKVGTPTNLKSTTVPQSSYFADPTTYGALGSDYLYLLSHKSQIPGKGKINFDNTLYGINLDQFVDEILPKTSSLVRGEELLELINMIVRFLTTHTHAFPGLPPVPVTQDGSNVTDMLTELQNAYTKILNSNIRLN
jgi:hypothetical protein